ncbi:ribosomal protein L30 [Kitasatospora atroaurantiaca]|uniref:Ribosomal protein L30 n=1 Tax=Kitasatospora atroaurantiaca TaxID=285545 RepID=A0A561EMT1_9ACTN|nr:ribosomal protein L30 [Kitasatospora atroaurantiaca]
MKNQEYFQFTVHVSIGREAMVIQNRRPKTEHQRRVLAGMGLRRIGARRTMDQHQPAIRGMLRAVHHLVEIDPSGGPEILVPFNYIYEVEDGTLTEKLTFPAGQYIKITQGPKANAIAWSTELSPHKALAQGLKLLPSHHFSAESTGEVTWKSSGEMVADLAPNVLRKASKKTSRTAFMWLGFEAMAITWLAEELNHHHARQLGIISADRNLEPYSDFITSTAQTVVSRGIQSMTLLRAMHK